MITAVAQVIRRHPTARHQSETSGRHNYVHPSRRRPPGFSLVAHVRRLQAAGSVLYIRIGKSDISRLGLRHGQAIEIDLALPAARRN